MVVVHAYLVMVAEVVVVRIVVIADCRGACGVFKRFPFEPLCSGRYRAGVDMFWRIDRLPVVNLTADVLRFGH